MTAEPLPLPPDGARLSPVELVEVRDRLVEAGLGDEAMDPGSAIAAVELEDAVGATTLDRLAACNLLGRTESGRLGCPVVLRPLAGVLISSARLAAPARP